VTHFCAVKVMKQTMCQLELVADLFLDQIAAGF
jgi:hypothetical protein